MVAIYLKIGRSNQLALRLERSMRVGSQNLVATLLDLSYLSWTLCLETLMVPDPGPRNHDPSRSILYQVIHMHI